MPDFFLPIVQKLHLDVQMGEHSTDPNTERTKDSMAILEDSLSHMIDQMTYITRQQEYQRVNKYCLTVLPAIMTHHDMIVQFMYITQQGTGLLILEQWLVKKF